jgi:hypothetical protein
MGLSFIQNKISELRLQKGHYISEGFAQNLDKVRYALSSAVHNHTKSAEEMLHTKPEKISDSMVDCCLYRIEENLQEIVTTQQKQEMFQIIHKLDDLVQDLYSLAFYIRYSINPQRYASDQIELRKKAGMYISGDAISLEVNKFKN